MSSLFKNLHPFDSSRVSFETSSKPKLLLELLSQNRHSKNNFKAYSAQPTRHLKKIMDTARIGAQSPPSHLRQSAEAPHSLNDLTLRRKQLFSRIRLQRDDTAIFMPKHSRHYPRFKNRISSYLQPTSTSFHKQPFHFVPTKISPQKIVSRRKGFTVNDIYGWTNPQSDL